MRTLFVFFTLAFALSVAAQGQDGSTFLETCGAALKQADGAQVSQDESMRVLYCVSYVSGFLDAMSVTVTSTKGQRNLCMPERGITNDQAIRIFVKFLRENPQTLHQSGRMSLYIALAKAFPCK